MYAELETPPTFVAETILNFHFDYWIISLRSSWRFFLKFEQQQGKIGLLSQLKLEAWEKLKRRANVKWLQALVSTWTAGVTSFQIVATSLTRKVFWVWFCILAAQNNHTNKKHKRIRNVSLKKSIPPGQLHACGEGRQLPSWLHPLHCWWTRKAC